MKSGSKRVVMSQNKRPALQLVWSPTGRVAYCRHTLLCFLHALAIPTTY